jgi:DNA-directed RNA polymerase
VIGRKEQSKCFLAHIVHSLDAYVLRNIVAKCKDHHIDIMCIHDSFGVHPNYVHLVMQWYREELSKLVLLNPLPKMIEEIFGHKIALPNYGTDRKELATQILQSEYALS